MISLNNKFRREELNKETIDIIYFKVKRSKGEKVVKQREKRNNTNNISTDNSNHNNTSNSSNKCNIWRWRPNK